MFGAPDGDPTGRAAPQSNAEGDICLCGSRYKQTLRGQDYCISKSQKRWCQISHPKREITAVRV